MISSSRKMYSLCLLLTFLPHYASALAPISHIRSNHKISNTCSALKGSRRDLFERSIDNVVSAVCVVTTTTTTMISTPDIVYADVDFSAIQDLLGPATEPVQEYVPGGKRPMYLVEPTAEFKENEIKALEFKRANLKIKKSFTDAIIKITDDPNDGNVLASDLDRVTKLVKVNKGLPEGITKDDIIKICRRRKSKKFWPTDVEIA